MSRISQRTLERVEEQSRILDLFEGVSLKRMGREFLAVCPWHDDRRPSLAINPQKNFAYCHVCQHGVSPLGWLLDRGSSFTEAVEQLAVRYGIEVELENPEDNERHAKELAQKANLYALREQEQKTFAANLWANSEACLYLKRRGITRATAESWGLGLAGGRIMIPLRDPQGRGIAFTGRALGDLLPKYKNSPNDCLYEKSQLVFGLDRAIASIRRSHEVVIVEGQFDVIKLHQEGIDNVVAVSGTALSLEQIKTLIRRSGARVVTICFDGDRAGENAARKALEKLQGLAITETITLRILTLEAGRDPDSICREDGAEAVRVLLSSAPNWVEWWLGRELERVDLRSAESVTLAEQGVKRILRALPLGPRRSYVERRAAEVLGSAPSAPAAPAVETKASRDARKWAERRALRTFLLIPESRQALADIAPVVPPYAIAWAIIQTLLASAPGESLLALFGRVIRSLPEDDFQELRSLVSPVPEVLSWLRQHPARETTAAVNGMAATGGRKPTASSPTP